MLINVRWWNITLLYLYYMIYDCTCICIIIYKYWELTPLKLTFKFHISYYRWLADQFMLWATPLVAMLPYTLQRATHSSWKELHCLMQRHFGDSFLTLSRHLGFPKSSHGLERFLSRPMFESSLSSCRYLNVFITFFFFFLNITFYSYVDSDIKSSFILHMNPIDI